jgi:hypothetical protein
VLDKLHGHQILWKIDNYNKRLKDAEENVTLAVESPIFNLSRDGYKMQMSACLNGDGKGISNLSYFVMSLRQFTTIVKMMIFAT